MLDDPEYREKVLQSRKEARKRYYEKHKDRVALANKKWRSEHREQFNKLVYSARKKKAERLKAEGEHFCWMTNAEREKRKKMQS
jgi:hypothetical protein